LNNGKGPMAAILKTLFRPQRPSRTSEELVSGMKNGALAEPEIMIYYIKLYDK
jgi:hypothetical protein